VSVHGLHSNGQSAKAWHPAQAKVAEVEFKDRATKAFLIVPVPPLPLPKAGEYDFIVLADGQEIDRQQFIAISPEQQNGTDSPKNLKNRTRTPPTILTPYTPMSIRGPLPANWYIAQMVVLNPPQPVRKHQKRK
jgi:hypothetical protein